MERVAQRRAVFGGILAGGAVASFAGTPAEAAAAWTPRAVRADALSRGDLVVGPDGAILRLSEIRRLSNGQVRLQVTDDSTGELVPLNKRWHVTGVPGTMTLVVLARGVTERSITFGGRTIIDAGDRSTTAQLRRGTQAQWVEVDPVLAAGEPGFEIDSMRLKIGDGTARWSELPYLAGAGAGGATTRGHFVGDDLGLARPSHSGPVDWITTVDGVPRHIARGDWITRVEPLTP